MARQEGRSRGRSSPPSAKAASRLVAVLAALRAHHGTVAPPPLKDPFALLLHEQVAYLADDDRRLAAFRELERQVGLLPEDILAAPLPILARIARLGGAVGVERRARRLREVASRVKLVHQGDLSPVLRLPAEEAVRELARFPAIGRPGAERILLLCGARPFLALDSNALRVLQRLGYGEEHARYERAHRSAQAAAEAELPARVPARREASLLLRQHGRTLCRRSRPRCGACPVASACPSAEGP